MNMLKVTTKKIWGDLVTTEKSSENWGKISGVWEREACAGTTCCYRDSLWRHRVCGRCDDADVVLIIFPPNSRPQTRTCAHMRPPTLMSITNEAEVQFVSRRKSNAAYHYNSHSPAPPVAADSTAIIGFQAHYRFLSGLTRLNTYQRQVFGWVIVTGDGECTRQ